MLIDHEVLRSPLFSVEIPKLVNWSVHCQKVRIIREHSSCLCFYISSYLPQTTHSFPKTNLFHEKVVTKRARSLQWTRRVGDCSFGRFLVREYDGCSLVELVIFDLGLTERFLCGSG